MADFYASRKRRSSIVMSLCVAATGLGLAWLLIILATLLWNGVGGLSLAIFTQNTPPPNAQGGGLANAIAGSLVLTAIGTGVGAPIGLLAGTYMAEYGRYEKVTTLVRFINDALLTRSDD